MVTLSVREQIIYQLERLTPEQQQQVLEFTTRLVRPRGVPARSLLRFAGRIDPDDLQKMEKAIEEDCERIDADEW